MFFIVGVGRSGSTLLQTLLDAHSNVIVPQEGRVILYLYAQYEKVARWDENLIDAFIADLYSEAKFKLLWGVEKVELRKRLIQMEDLNFQKAIEQVYLLYDSPFPKEKITHVGDKNPVYSHVVPDLIKLFPDAKFIHLVRDFRANIESQMRLEPAKGSYMHTLRWIFMNEHIEAERKKNPKQFHLVRYEDLVDNPEQTLKKICLFLDLPYEAEMLNYYERFSAQLKVLEHTEPRKWKLLNIVHPNLLRPMNSSHKETWRERLSSNEISLIESLAGEYARTFGYNSDRTSQKSRLFKRLLYYFWHYKIIYYYKIPLKVRRLMFMIGDTKLKVDTRARG